MEIYWIIHCIHESYVKRSENVHPAYIVLYKLLAAFIIKNFQKLELLFINFFVFKGFLKVFPTLISLFSFQMVFFFSVVLGHIFSQDQEKLFKRRRFTNSSDPKQKDRKMRKLKIEFTFWVVLNQLLDVHQAEFIHNLLFWSHWISKLPT